MRFPVFKLLNALISSLRAKSYKIKEQEGESIKIALMRLIALILHNVAHNVLEFSANLIKLK
jgi:hypothetical protein